MTSLVAVSEGKKAEEGTMISPLEPGFNLVAVADSPESQTEKPATTE
jgi:hypothetical protein